MTLINISEDLAKSQNISVGKYNLVYLLLIVLIVALGVKVVGGLLTAAIVAIPATASRNLAKNLAQYKFLSFEFWRSKLSRWDSHFASNIVAGWTINHSLQRLSICSFHHS
jgi:hypothetical protein